VTRFHLALSLAAAPLCAQSLAPLPIALPKPMFEGTPVVVKVANLEKPLGKPRPPFLAPAGTVNVARGKLATASGGDPVRGDLEQITDGDKEGRDGSFVELKPGVQSVTLDLERKCVIYAVLVWHYHKDARVYHDIVIQTAADPDFIEGVRTIFNNDHDNTAGFGLGREMNYVETSEGKLADARGVEARYVRLYSNGNSASAANHYVEVEVYGKPLP
jgi:hypothetical protein